MLSRPEEQLEAHIERVLNSYNNLVKYKNIDLVFENIINKLCKDEDVDVKEFLQEMILDVLMLHDKGKENPYFQAYIGNMDFANENFDNINKQHSIISSYYFLQIYKEKIENILSKTKKRAKYGKFLKDITLSCAYIISRHHGSLGDVVVNELLDRKITDLANMYPRAFFCGFNESILKFYKGYNKTYINNYTKYIFIKYLYSVLVTCDYMAVYEFVNKNSLDIHMIDDMTLERFISDLEETDIVKNIRKYPGNKDKLSEVNKYRTEMFLESEINLLKQDNNMFYLEAPTGSGKSVTSLNLSLNLIKNNYNKIYYVAPFINIIEQTYKDVKSFIGRNNKDVVLLSSKEEIISDEDIDTYEQDYLDNLMINYPLSIISHVRLFNMLFGTTRKQNISMALIPNSVIILDEIQSYKNKIWIPIINLLKEYSELLNIKIIIMSATLPKLDVLLEDKMYKFGNLIERRDYYYDFFKTRVENDFSMLYQEHTQETLYNKIDHVINNNEKNRILIGLIKIKTCEEIYTDMLQYKKQGFEVFKIQGNTPTNRRNYIINRLKEKDENGEYLLKKVILVATQCIEAGVDIDMNIGFKNISILDSDEQFCGRIERNFKNKGIVYFFKIDDCSIIYKDDYRSERTLLNEEWQQLLEQKDFDKFYHRNYKWLLQQNLNSNLKKEFDSLHFTTIYKQLELIQDDGKENIILDYKYMDNLGNIIDCSELLDKYLNVLHDYNMNYANKQIILSQIRKRLNMFFYTVDKYDIDKINGLIKMDNGLIVVQDSIRFFNNTKDNLVVDESELDTSKLTGSYEFI